MLDTNAYSRRVAERATFAAYALALDSGQTPHESFAAALSVWQNFRPDDGNLEAHENVVPIALAVLDLDETEECLISADCDGIAKEPHPR